MSKLKLPIIIAIVLAAAGAGLFFSGMVGSTPDTKTKHAVEPVPLAQDFTVNLKDTEADHYAVLTVALQLEPMDQAHFDTFTGANAGGHGGGGEAPGPPKLASYPKFHDAIVAVTSTFSASELKTPEGKQQLKESLLTRFAEIAEQDASEYKSADPHHVGPPYHVMDVYFPKIIVS